jgi:hypothetical protein
LTDALLIGSYGRYGGTCFLHFQGLSSPLMMDVAGFSVTYLFNAGMKSLRVTLPAEIFYWDFEFLKGSLRDVFTSRSALQG